MHPLITSLQNPKIKNIITLEKARERRQQNVFVIEGIKELSLAANAGYTIHSVFFCPSITHDDIVLEIVGKENLLIPIAQHVFEKLAYRNTTGGVIALAGQKKHELGSIRLGKNSLLLILESVEKPGNLGAILRTADAAGVDAVIICDPQTDFYNPNVIRSSVGCVFTTAIASAASTQTIQWLKDNNIQCLATHLDASIPYHEVDYNKSSAIILGTESTGLSKVWVEAAHTKIIIPMHGKIDSLNVSTAAAIIVFEANRQRGK
jgi:TrmH family RNA methyltransferase